MKKLFYSVIIVAIAAASCKKTSMYPDDTVSAASVESAVKEQSAATATKFKDYVIRKGNYYCDQTLIKFTNTTSLKARVIFDSSAIYTSIKAENQGDINKLLGFSDCGTHHQQNSARLGWSWNGQKLVIYGYAYVNNVRMSRTLGTVNLNEPFSCSVSAVKNYYQFKAGNYTDSIPRHCPDFKGYRYKLYPYFGGDEAAPHDVHIAIAEE